MPEKKAIDWEVKDTFATQLEPAADIADKTSGEDWENPQITGHHRLAPHVPNRIFNTKEDALTLTKFGACQPLNGTWQFHVAPIPQEVPAGFYEPDFDDSSWSTIQVPGHWELQGFGQPIYTNIIYPFPLTPPRVPAKDNPTGCYRRTFEVPKDWDGRQLLMVFEGVDSAFELYLNGKSIGYSTGSRVPAEFDITDPTENAPRLRHRNNSLRIFCCQPTSDLLPPHLMGHLLSLVFCNIGILRHWYISFTGILPLVVFSIVCFAN